jgi:predicted phosphodiesterase
VGYAPWPNETVALLEAEGIKGVSGNYDSTVAMAYEHCGCRYEDPRQEELSHLSYAWTREHVTEQTRAVLEALPFRMDLRTNGGHQPGPRIILLHGSPDLNTVYWAEERDDSFCLKMAERAGARAKDSVVFGHTHIPWEREVEGIRFINAGSVGRPKDGDWRACYLLLHLAPSTVDAELVRVEYDLERAVQGIRDSELPDDFGDFLETGGRP